MPLCRRCNESSVKALCPHCRGKVDQLKHSWDAMILDLSDELASHMKTAFRGLEDKPFYPIPIELAVNAVVGMSEEDQAFYLSNLKQIYEELVRPQPGEFPTEEELRETEGDRKFHALRDEGRL